MSRSPSCSAEQDLNLSVQQLHNSIQLIIIHSTEKIQRKIQILAAETLEKHINLLQFTNENRGKPGTSVQCRGYECVELYLHSPIRLHRVVPGFPATVSRDMSAGIILKLILKDIKILE